MTFSTIKVHFFLCRRLTHHALQYVEGWAVFEACLTELVIISFLHVELIQPLFQMHSKNWAIAHTFLFIIIKFLFIMSALLISLHFPLSDANAKNFSVSPPMISKLFCSHSFSVCLFCPFWGFCVNSRRPLSFSPTCFLFVFWCLIYLFNFCTLLH